MKTIIVLPYRCCLFYRILWPDRDRQKKAQDAGEGGILALRVPTLGVGGGGLTFTYCMLIRLTVQSLPLIYLVQVFKLRGPETAKPRWFDYLPGFLSGFPGRHLVFISAFRVYVWKAQVTLLMPA